MTDNEIRARNAAALKENPLLQEILAQIQTEAVAAWLATPADGGQAKREFAWMLSKAASRLGDVIQGAIDNGTIEARRAATAPLR